MNILMRKIPTLLGLLFFVVLIAGYAIYARRDIAQVAPETVPTKVRITNVSDNKFTVSWITGVATTGSIEYGVVGDKLITIAKDERDVANQGKYLSHYVTIEKLQPSTQYAFRILSGEKPTRFDNSGNPYTASTGPVIGATPTSQNFYGKVQLLSKQPANGAIVYLTLPNGATTSTLVKESGNYAITLSTIRTADLRSYISYDPSATIVGLTIELGDQQSISSVSLVNSAPVPTITLGQNIDYLNKMQAPDVAEIQTGQTEESNQTNQSSPILPHILNVEPITSQAGGVNTVATQVVTILNPKEPGETLNTLRPEFRGEGPLDLTLSIALTGQKAISDTVRISKDGTWSWTPAVDLKIGRQTITISYLATDGTTQKMTRDFTISNTVITYDPAFVSSPSASTKTNTVITSAVPREAMPATDSGVPVTGIIENTVLTGGLGIIILLMGTALLIL